MKLIEPKKKNSKLKPFLIGSISLLSIVGISMAGYSYFEQKNQLTSVSSVEKQAFLNKVAENMQEKYGEAFSESDVSSETATISQIPGISSSPKIITVQKEAEPKTTEAAKEVKEDPKNTYEKVLTALNKQNFIAYQDTGAGYIYYVSLNNAIFSLQGAPDKAWEIDLYVLNKPESKTYHFHSTNKSKGAGRETLSQVNPLERLFPFLYNSTEIEESDDGWDIVAENTTYHINGKDTIRFIINTTTDQTIYFASIDALETTYPEIAEYFKSYSNNFISIMEKKMQSSVGKDNQEGQTACQYAEHVFTNALLKLASQKTLDDIANDNAAVEAERISFIKALDMTEDDFNTVLADIKNFDITDYEITGYEKSPNKDAMDIHYFNIKSNDKCYTVFFSETRHNITNMIES